MSNQTLVHIVQHLKPGGIETMALSLALASQRFADVHVISLEGNGNEVELDFADAPALRSKLHFLGKPAGVSWATVRELRRILARLQPAAVYTHHIGPLLYGGIAGRMAGIKTFVHTVHDVWHLEDQKQRGMEGILVRALSPIIVVHGQGNACTVKSIWPSAEVQVIPTGVDLQRFAPGDRAEARRALGLPQNVVIVGCAARLEKEKGHWVLIDALSRLPDHVHLALAGDGAEADALRSTAESLAMDQRVHFLGRLTDMPAFYRASDLFCLASLNEGLPISAIEAQASGVPAVLSDVGLCEEALDSQSGMLVPAGDAAALAHALHCVLSETPTQSPRMAMEADRDLRVMALRYASLGLPEDVLETRGPRTFSRLGERTPIAVKN